MVNVCVDSASSRGMTDTGSFVERLVPVSVAECLVKIVVRDACGIFCVFASSILIL